MDRTAGIEAMYDEFKAFYTDELKRANTKYNKFRLHLTTMFFDDLDLIKRMTPHFNAVPTNVAEKQAIAKAAYWDALVRHAFGIQQDATVSQLFKNDEDIENRVVALEKQLADYLKTKAK